MVVRVIDTETTGTDPTKDHVIEIASVDLTKDGYRNPMSTLVKPIDGTLIPPQASAVNHIIDSDVASALPLNMAVMSFLGADAYVAHQAEFDSRFLPMIKAPWICTYKVSLRAWPEAPSHSNQALRYWLGEVSPFGMDRKDIHPHRASSDVIVTAAIFHQLLKVVSYGTMLEWSAEPPLFPRWTFGKFRGQPIAAADDGWIDWVLGKDDLGEWHSTCRAEKARRSQMAA